MAKVALLVGVSVYGPGFSSLPGVHQDLEAMQRILEHPHLGKFDQVRSLINPDPPAMEAALTRLFLESNSDLALLYFSGQGVQDDRGQINLATAKAGFNPQGKLIPTTVVAASAVQDLLRQTPVKQAAVILDCYFHEAFASSLSGQGSKSKEIDIQSQFGGQEWAVLTAFSSTQSTLNQKGSKPSAYTHYFVEGVETGAADLDDEGTISLGKAHEYASCKVQQASPVMQPQLYNPQEASLIQLAKAPRGNPQLRYRREVERCAKGGQISLANRKILDLLRDRMQLSATQAAEIEAAVLNPYQSYQHKLQEYRQALTELSRQGGSWQEDTYSMLKRVQQNLGLKDEDTAPIKAETNQQTQVIQSLNQAVKGMKVNRPKPPRETTPARVAVPIEPTSKSPIEPTPKPDFALDQNIFPDAGTSGTNLRLMLGTAVATALTLAGAVYVLLLIVPARKASQKPTPSVPLSDSAAPEPASPLPLLPSPASPSGKLEAIPPSPLPRLVNPPPAPEPRPPLPAISLPRLQIQKPAPQRAVTPARRSSPPPAFPKPARPPAPKPQPQPTPNPEPPPVSETEPQGIPLSPQAPPPAPEPPSPAAPLPSSWSEPPPTSAPNPNY